LKKMLQINRFDTGHGTEMLDMQLNATQTMRTAGDAGSRRAGAV
jgi:hypothetical protein